MQIVSLTTDFGTRDFYVAGLKAALFSRRTDLQLVDISHEIESFNILKAVFLLKNVWQSFPKNTIHIIAVNNFYDENFRFLVARRDGHFFVAPDNGILSLLLENLKIEDIRSLDYQADNQYPLRDVFADAVGHLAMGLDFEKIGSEVENFTQRIHFQPITTPNYIRGAVLHIDFFENVVVNISKETFEKVGNGRPFSLFFRKNDAIRSLSKNYCDVPIGEPLCFFNSSNLLKISINMGRAASLLNLKTDDLIQIDFH